MISASKTIFSHFNLNILRSKVTKNIKNLNKKFCESAPSPVFILITGKHYVVLTNFQGSDKFLALDKLL